MPVGPPARWAPGHVTSSSRYLSRDVLPAPGAHSPLLPNGARCPEGKLGVREGFRTSERDPCGRPARGAGLQGTGGRGEHSGGPEGAETGPSCLAGDPRVGKPGA